MSEIFGDSELSEDSGRGSESGYVAQLGRISGKLLKENLIRNGVDLAFDTDLLYLKVAPIIRGSEADGEDGDPNYDSTLPSALSGTGIGINTDTPIFDLDVASDVRSTVVNVTSQANIDNVIINADGYFSTIVGELHIQPTSADVIFHNRLTTSALSITGNVIGSLNNQNIVLNPNAAGTIELQTNTFSTGDIDVTGNIRADGDLASASTIIVGDSPLDVVTIAPDFSQGIIPGLDNEYDLGSSLKRWSQVHVPDLTNINNTRPDSAMVSTQLRIDGLNRTIFATQSNEDLSINPSTGISYIESLKIEGNVITNLVSTRTLDQYAIANGITQSYLGTPGYEFWNTITTGEEYFLGGGQTVITQRTAALGDLRNDLDNFAAINADDANLAISIGNRTSGTLNEQIWYHTVIKPYITGNPVLEAEYSNGEDEGNTPITIVSTGTGYIRFNNTNAMVIPSGTSDERQYTEVGDTRWNTELQYLECFDGNVYLIATGPGEVVSTDLMTDLAITRALFLG